MQKITATEKELRRVFSNDYVFEIPPYQRPYSWTEDQASELFADLTAHLDDYPDADLGRMDEVAPHFLGSIVLIKEEGRTKAEVVDGQQRLTTLTLLLCVLRDMAGPSAGSFLHGYICEVGNPIEGNKDRYRLTLRPRDREFFQSNVQVQGAVERLVHEGGFNNDVQERLIQNARFFWKAVVEMTPDERLRFSAFLMQRCFLVVVSASDQESAYRIFSVMNDRGLNLSATDILKAEIIGALPDAQKDVYTATWEGIEEELGSDEFAELFSHIRMIFVKQKARAALTKEFREGVKAVDNPAQFIDSVLQPYADAYGIVGWSAYESKAGAEPVNRTLEHLNRLENYDWVPPALVFFRDNRHSPAELLKFFKDLERLAYGMYVMRANINVRINRYAEVLKALETGADLYAEGSPLQLRPEEQKDIATALDGPIYQQIRVRTPLLLRLDSALADAGVNYDHKVISIEHVLPQSPVNGSVWHQWFPDPDERDYWTHRLANLVLLSRQKNGQAQNYDFDRKKKEYFQRKGVSPFALTSQVLNEAEWTPEVLEKRQRTLIKALCKEWRL
ncbi:DUF262 domain-containing protein [Caenispirillum bisanense]